MTEYDKWCNECPHCQADLRDGGGTRLVHVVDRDKDCVTSYRCPDCNAVWLRSLGEVIAVME
jgi:hypothetical protein